MKIFSVISAILITAFFFSFSLHHKKEYNRLYESSVNDLDKQLSRLLEVIKNNDVSVQTGREHIRRQIKTCRLSLKGLDFWFRYFEPVAYRKINGPLPVEWENEVFEKFEPPYRREGARLR